MATNTSTIGSTGKDYATVTLWEGDTDNDLVAAGDIEVGSIDAAENFDESVVIAGATTDATNYRKLTVNASFRHAGLEGTGHARMYRTGSGHILDVQEDFFIIEYLDLNLESGQASSDECIRVNSGITAMVSRCILHQDSNVVSCDGVYTGDWNAGVYVDNCIVYHFQRHGLHLQIFAGTGATQEWFIDQCTVMDCNRDGLGSAGGIFMQVATDNAGTMNVFNTACMDSGGATPLDFGSTGSGTKTWVGSDNIAETASAEDKFTDSFDLVTLTDADDSDPASGEHLWVTQKDHPSEDYRLNDENAFTVSQNGVDRVGSEPADLVWTGSVQDFTIDIAGRSRVSQLSITIGAHQFAQKPTFTSVTPDNGTDMGGTSVVIVGDFFRATQGDGTVTFDGVEVVSYEAWGDTSISCTTPAGTAGAVDIVIKESNEDSVTAAGGYTYVTPPTPINGDGVAVQSMGFDTGFSIGVK